MLLIFINIMRFKMSESNLDINSESNYVKILNKIYSNIQELEKEDQFSYDLFVQMYFNNLKILKAVTNKEKFDISDAIVFISDVLGFSLTDLVKESFNQLKRNEELKESTENLSNEEKKLVDQVLRNADVVKDVKNYNFESFIKNLGLGELEGLTCEP